MVEVAIRAGPMSVGDASCITEFTANCRNRNHFHEHQTYSNEGYFRTNLSGNLFPSLSNFYAFKFLVSSLHCLKRVKHYHQLYYNL